MKEIKLIVNPNDLISNEYLALWPNQKSQRYHRSRSEVITIADSLKMRHVPMVHTHETSLSVVFEKLFDSFNIQRIKRFTKK